MSLAPKHSESKVWELILSSLDAQIPVQLLLVLESNGSSPGRQGFKMAVNAAGAMAGSLGGGIMEHKLVELARHQLQQSEISSNPVIRQVHRKDAAEQQSGMICSGEQTIWMHILKPDERMHVERMIRACSGEAGWVLMAVPHGIFVLQEIRSLPFQCSLIEDQFVYKEKAGFKRTLHIAGGGHCALAFSELASRLDFYIHLYEERPGLNTLQANRYIHELHILEDYAKLGHLIPEGPDQYVVLMTFGYRTDELALRTLTNKQVAFLGMLGSRSKVTRLLQQLNEEGIPKEWTNTIYTPVGLPINSQTPDEIAVSIAAQMIQHYRSS